LKESFGRIPSHINEAAEKVDPHDRMSQVYEDLKRVVKDKVNECGLLIDVCKREMLQQIVSAIAETKPRLGTASNNGVQCVVEAVEAPQDS